MKIKVIIPILCSIIIGFLFGKLLFNEYDSNTINAFEEGETVFFIKMGTFESENDIKEKYDNLNSYLVLIENEKYVIYGGITKNKNTALKIKEYYQDVAKDVSVEEKIINDQSFLNILNEYDKITTIALSDNDLIDIEKIVISNYKEMVLEQ